MGEATTFDKQRTLSIVNDVVVDASLDEDKRLIMTKQSGEVVQGSSLQGPKGLTGPPGGLLSTRPIGSIYISVLDNNPSEVFGGTWEPLAPGRTPVGVDSSQSEFDTVNEIGGEIEHQLSAAEVPAHKHTIDHDHESVTSGSTEHTHNEFRFSTNASGSDNNSLRRAAGSGSAGYGSYSPSAPHAHSIDIPAITHDSGFAGGNEPHSNIQPYVAVYIWKRTA